MLAVRDEQREQSALPGKASRHSIEGRAGNRSKSKSGVFIQYDVVEQSRCQVMVNSERKLRERNSCES